MGTKKREEYLIAFQNFLLVANINGFILRPTKVMCDFESALRDAIQHIIKPSKLLGCSFHYIKALWKKIKKLGLFRKFYIKDVKFIRGTCIILY